ncbi:MAG: All-trans-phytoene synthase [Pseudomonadota bacterium]|jgi:farnesyl-diphosphate farnesyltransferase
MQDQAHFSPRTPARQKHEHLKLLQGVSRSFHLSIRLLPLALQAPIAVGYLLARATDTVADTTTLPVAERQALLDAMAHAIASPQPATAALSAQAQAFAAQQKDPHEQALMQALPQCLAWLHQLSAPDQASVRTVLGHITRGQSLDMTRFGTGLHALQTEDELSDYTWLVAGCVGEFWTELCERHLPGFARLPTPDMMALGRAYGMGLQRLNILRDAGTDLIAGRCYWPEDTLVAAGLSPQALAQCARDNDPSTRQALSPLWTAWLDQTQAQLNDGLRYSCALKGWRLRLASALPALIGARTVALLRQAGPQALSQRVKMPRREVRALLWRLVLGLVSPNALRREYERLSGPWASPATGKQ